MRMPVDDSGWKVDVVIEDAGYAEDVGLPETHFDFSFPCEPEVGAGTAMDVLAGLVPGPDVCPGWTVFMAWVAGVCLRSLTPETALFSAMLDHLHGPEVYTRMKAPISGRNPG